MNLAWTTAECMRELLERVKRDLVAERHALERQEQAGRLFADGRRRLHQIEMWLADLEAVLARDVIEQYAAARTRKGAAMEVHL